MDIHEKIIKVGSAKYDNKTPYKIEILETNFKPGSGDYEDPPEIQNDHFGTFYQIKYYSPVDSTYTAGGGWYNSLNEAITAADKKAGGIIWKN